MANVTVKGTFKELTPYLPDAGEAVAQMIDLAFRLLTPAERAADDMTLSITQPTSTKAELTDTAGAKPLLVAVKSNGTACWVVFYNADADDVTVGTTEIDYAVPVAGTADELSVTLAAGLSWERFWATGGITIAALTTIEGTGNPTNAPTAYILYKAA